MERLTYRSPEFNDPVSYGACKGIKCSLDCDSCKINDLVCKLCEYEDSGLEPEDVRRLQQDWTSLIMTLDELGGMPHLHELVQAEKDGRLRILPKSQDNTCGSCGHFKLIPGKRAGLCEVRTYYTNRRGKIDASRGTFTPSQSQKCCKQYIPREEAEAALEGGGE